MLLWESLLGAPSIPSTPLLFIWGSGQGGQLADANSTGSPLNLATVRSWSAVTTTSASGWAIRNDGLLFGWGSNNVGQLGLGDLATKFSPTQIGTSSWTSVSSGGQLQFVMAIRQGGTLFTWGQNDSGQLGLGDTNNRSSPTQLGTSSWTVLGTLTGAGTAAAIRQGGTLFTWGSSSGLGLIGDGSFITRSSPTQIGTSSWTAVSVGPSTAAAIRQGGTLFTWGSSSGGKLGNYINGTTPPSQTSWRTVSYWQFGGMGIDSLNRLYGWGLGDLGVLGLGNQSEVRSPTQIGSSSWTAVAISDYKTLAIRADGRLFSWGFNQWGELGLDDTTARSSPTQVGTSSWTQISINSSYVAAIRQGGTLFTWGRNNTATTGDFDDTARSSPVQVGTQSWLQVAAGGGFLLARRSDETLWSWGGGNDGTLGLANVDGITAVPGSWVILGASYSGDAQFAINAAGQLWSWGSGGNGMLGRPITGPNYNRPRPVDNNSYTFLSTGEVAAFAIRSNGTLWAWGQNYYGQLGLGDTDLRSLPTQVPGSWTQVHNQFSRTVAIRADGTLWIWGYDGGGLGGLGLPQAIDRSSPVQVMAGSWTSVRTGRQTLARRLDGTVWTWGGPTSGSLGLGNQAYGVAGSTQVTVGLWNNIDSSGGNHALGVQFGLLYGWLNNGSNAYGQLGLGSTEPPPISSAPAMVDRFGTNVWRSALATVAAGLNTSAAINEQGRLFVWGRNDAGQLGLGDLASRSSPTQLGTSSWTQVWAGLGRMAALRTDGRLFVWGENTGGGLLGLGDTNNRSSPTQLGTSSWVMIDLGVSQTIAIRQGGTLFTWGNSNNGEIGNGTFIARSSPTQIGTSSWIVVSAGTNLMGAVRSDQTAWTWGAGGFWGDIGDGYQESRSSPVQITFSGNTKWISMGSGGGVVVSNAGRVEGWGLGNSGQFWFRWTGSPARSPSSDIVGDSAQNSMVFVKVGKGDEANWSYGTTSAWGGNEDNGSGNRVVVAGTNGLTMGFQGNGNGNPSQSPILLGIRASQNSPIRAFQNSWTIIGVGDDWALRYRSGTTYAESWGRNTNGQLGIGDTTTGLNRSSPVQIGTMQNPSNIKIHGNRGMAVGFFSRLQVWGRNNVGQAGKDPNTSPNVFQPDDPWDFLYDNIRDYAFNSNGSIAVQTNTVLRWWGQSSVIDPDYWNTFQFSYRSSPTQTSIWNPGSPNQIGTDRSWKNIAAATSHAVAVGQIGSQYYLYTWGNNLYGQLGTNDVITRSSPILVSSTLDANSQPTASQYAVFWLRDSGVVATGYNNQGALGLGDTINRSVLATVGSGGGISNFGGVTRPDPAGANSIGFGLTGTTNSFTLVSWGQDNLGGVVNLSWWSGTRTIPTFTDAAIIPSPVQVGTLSWSQVGMGSQFSVGRINTNRLYVWGINNSNTGQLGLGLSITDIRGSPVELGTSSYAQVSVSSDYTFALKIDGTALAWGSGSGSRFGNGEAVNRSSPVAAASGSWTSLHAGANSGWGIATSNLWLYGWSNAPATTVQGYSPGQFTPSVPRLVYDTLRYSPVQLGSASWKQVSNGWLHSLAISSDDKLWAWGLNSNGQLGDGTTNSNGTTSPVQIGSGNWSRVSTGTNSSAAIRQDGTLWTWGLNTAATLGLGDAISRSSPTQVGTLSWKQVRVAGSGSVTFTLAIRQDDTLWGWGFAQNGGLGLGVGNTQINSPVQIGTSTWSAIAEVFPQMAVAAIRSDGVLFSWGQNSLGQLGLSDWSDRSSPTQVGTSSWIAVSIGRSHVLGLTRVSPTRGTLFAWGANFQGQLGTGAPTGLSWSAVSASQQYTARIDSQGRLWMAGTGSNGRLGLGDLISRSIPVILGDRSWKQVATGAFGYTLAIRSDDTLWSWGFNSAGELGLGDTIERSSPVQVGTSLWTQISMGYQTALAIRQDGRLFGWGRNDSGDIGLGDTFYRSSPTQVGSSNWSAVSAGTGYSLAIRQGGTLFAWGYNQNGMLGLNDVINRSSPAQVGTSSWTQVCAYPYLASQAIRQGGTLFTWGYGTEGRLGLGDNIWRSSPTQLGTSSWTLLPRGSGTAGHALAQLANGQLYAWGLNSSGQLGVSDFSVRSSPVLVSGGLSSWTSLSTSSVNSNGITLDGRVWGWGSQTNGSMGDNQSFTSDFNSPVLAFSPFQFIPNSPVQVGSQQWKDITAGDNVSGAINSSDLLYTWGLAINGWLGGPGSGSFVDRSSPVQVGTSSWTTVSMGFQNIIGITK